MVRKILHNIVKIYILVCFIALACNDNDTVLKVATESVPANHFDHWLTVVARQENAENVADVSLLIDRYRNRLFYFADAVDQGIDQNPEISEEVTHASKTILTQKSGPLHVTRVLSKTSVTSQMVEEAYKHQDNEFEIEFFYYPCGIPASIDTTNLQHCFINPDAFHDRLTGAKYVSGTYIWPYNVLYPFREAVYFAQEGHMEIYHDVSGDYIVHVSKRIPVTQRALSESEGYISAMLQNSMQSYFEQLYEKQLFQDGGFSIEPEVLTCLTSELTFSDSLSTIDENELSDICNQTLTSYYINGAEILITIGDFAKYYNKKTLREALIDESVLYSYVKDYAFTELAYADAVELGLTQTDSFLAEQRSYHHRVVLKYYDLYLMSQISLTEGHIQQEYSSHIQEFTEATVCDVSVLQFDAIDNANRVFFTMHPEQLDPSKYAALPGCVHVRNDVEMTREDAPFSAVNIRGLFSKPEHKSLRPFIENDITYLIIKHAETDSRIKPLDEVRDLIVQTLKKKKLEELKAELLPELKKKYKLVDNIDYDRYLSDEWIVSISAQE